MRSVILQRLLSARSRRVEANNEASTSAVPDAPEHPILVVDDKESVPGRPGLASVELNAPEMLRLFFLGRPALTADAYRRDLEAFAAFIGAPSVEHAVHALLNSPKQDVDVLAHEWGATMAGAPATRARRLGALRSLVKMARRFGALSWELDVKNPQVDKYRDTAGPGIEALRSMLGVAGELPGPQGLRARAVLLLVGTLGLRRGEVANLRVANFDAQVKRIYVVGKGDRQAVLTVPDITAQAVSSWIDVLERREPVDFLVQRLDRPGVGVTGQTIYKIITMLGKRAGVRTWPHGLRHTAVTEGTRAHGLTAASKFARHKDVKTTMIYQDNLENVAGKVADTLADMLLHVSERSSQKAARCLQKSRRGE